VAIYSRTPGTRRDRRETLMRKTLAGQMVPQLSGDYRPFLYRGIEGAGWGREFGDEGIEAYFETKSVMMNLNE